MRKSAVRAKASHDDETLEPVAVYEDGVPVEPVFASQELTSADAWSLARDCVDAVRAVLDEGADIRGQAPWAYIEPPDQVSWRPARFLATFSRMIGLHPSRLAALPGWWTRCARDGRVQVTRRLVLEAPRRGARDTWRLRGRLYTPWLVRSIPVELLLWPHLGGWTKLSLEPQRGVHCGDRYFRNGHRVLDVLTERLIRELDPVG
jgi:hypothetical protein